MAWGTGAVGDWHGRRVVITGANSGIGLEAARVLVAHGATVVLACRDVVKGEAAAASITPGGAGGTTGRAVGAHLDLASFASIHRFAEASAAEGEPIDALVDNAGVMACPLAFTEDGLELQMGTNHFGHALLTSLLLPRLAAGARVVVVSSIAARGGNLTASTTAEDLTAPAPYRPQAVYANTKQANLLFAVELQRRLIASGNGTTVIAVHPGVSATELFLRQMRDSGKGYVVPLARPFMKLVFQSAAAGAWPTLRALSDPALGGGEFVGPRHLGQSRGRPEVLELYPQGADVATAANLWGLTESVLGTPILPA
jgi:NAD(P)-dependent dehydrogenase (short-subunit alcohol dehydrogenase family)